MHSTKWSYCLHISCHNVIITSSFLGTTSGCGYIYNARKNCHQQKRLSIHNEISTTSCTKCAKFFKSVFLSLPKFSSRNSWWNVKGRQGHWSAVFPKSFLKAVFSLLLNRKKMNNLPINYSFMARGCKTKNSCLFYNSYASRLSTSCFVLVSISGFVSTCFRFWETCVLVLRARLQMFLVCNFKTRC